LALTSVVPTIPCSCFSVLVFLHPTKVITAALSTTVKITINFYLVIFLKILSKKSLAAPKNTYTFAAQSFMIVLLTKLLKPLNFYLLWQ
jgi:hypothetical protein